MSVNYIRNNFNGYLPSLVTWDQLVLKEAAEPFLLETDENPKLVWNLAFILF